MMSLIIKTFCKWENLGSEKENNLPRFIELIHWQCSSLNSVLPDATGYAQHAMVILPVCICYVTWTSGWWIIIDTWLKKKNQYFSLADHTGRMVLFLSQWNLHNEIAKGKKVSGTSDTFTLFNSWFALTFFQNVFVSILSRAVILNWKSFCSRGIFLVVTNGERIEARDAAKYPTFRIFTPRHTHTSKNYYTSNGNSYEVEKSCFRTQVRIFFFCKGPHNKYFRLCKPLGIWVLPILLL